MWGKYLKYRPEIDGLRAIAVLPVILFHAGFEVFSGGYVGVDVFFVISGYLITTILIDAIEQNSFSLFDFYERRARRILPALFFVMTACIPFAWVWMLPSQMEDFSQSLIAVTLFVSNFLFWLESGYFESAAEEKPLLHTWSLAVEEQYYLVFPIFLLLGWRLGRDRFFWLIAIMSLFSLSLAEWGSRYFPSANFFLAPMRAWELFAGSMVAVLIKKRGIQSNQWMSMLGLLGIGFAIFTYSASTPFPSVWALFPVIGTVLIILHGDQRTVVGRMLTFKGFVGIGLVSYSAYLWHQPLFAFARLRVLGEPDGGLMLLLSGATLILAYMTYRLVEQPFRNKARFSQRTIFMVSGAVMIVFVILGWQLPKHHSNKFFDLKYSEELIEAEKEARFEPLQDICTSKGWDQCNDPVAGKTNILIIGDSHGVDGLNAMYFATEAMRSELSFSMATLPGCPPAKDIDGLVSERFPNLEKCRTLNAEKRFNPVFLGQYDLIVISTLLGWYDETHLMAYVDYLHKVYSGEVIVFGAAFNFKDELPAYFNAGVWVDGSAEFFQYDPRPKEAELERVVRDAGFEFLSKQAVFCSGETCNFGSREGGLMSYDSSHLSLAYAQALGQAWAEKIRATIEKAKP